MTLWIAIIGMGIITYAIRLSLIVMSDRITLSDPVQQALRFVPAAVLSAIIAPDMFRPGGVLDISLGNARMVAGLVAIVVAWKTQNVLLTIGLGMLAMWGMQWLLSTI